MKKLLIMVVTTVTSTIGWALGAPVGIMTAFILSMVGFGLGAYAGNKLAKHWML